MKIIYCSYRGTYAAYIMAALHLGIYKEEIPSPDVLQRQWQVSMRYGEQWGNLVYMGLDENLWEVYILGCRGHLGMIKMAYAGMDKIFGIQDKVYYVDSSSLDTHALKITAKIFNYPWLDRVGQKIFYYWVRRIYRICQERVCNEKEKLKAGEWV